MVPYLITNHAITTTGTLNQVVSRLGSLYAIKIENNHLASRMIYVAKQYRQINYYL